MHLAGVNKAFDSYWQPHGRPPLLKFIMGKTMIPTDVDPFTDTVVKSVEINVDNERVKITTNV